VSAHNEITDDPNSGGDGAIDGYEELRRRALSGAADGWRLGLGVLQHRGVAGWLRRDRAGPAGAHPLGAAAGR
jgi:hypothetical protein